MREAETRVAKNYIIQFIGRVAGVLLGLATLAVMTRALGNDGYGVYTTALTYLQIAAVLVDGGLTLTFIQLIAGEREREDRMIRALFGLRILSAGAMLLFAVALAFFLPYPPLIRFAIAIGGASYLCLSSTGMLTGIFQKHLAMHRAVLSEIIGRLVTLALVAVTAILHQDVLWMMGAVTLGNAIHLIAIGILARPFVRLWPTIDTALWKHAVQLSWPIGLSTFFNLVYLKSDILILGAYYPQADVGIYGAGYRIIDVLTAFPVMYMGLVLPILAHALAEQKEEEARQWVGRTFDLFAIVALPLAVGTPFVAERLMMLVAGPAFAQSGPVLSILMVAIIPIFLSALSGHTIVALGKQRLIIWGYAATAVFSLLAYFLVIPRSGLLGAAWITVGSETLILLLTGAVVLRTLSLRLHLSQLFRVIAACAGMAVLLFALPTLPITATIILGAVTYISLLQLLGGGMQLRAITELFRST